MKSQKLEYEKFRFDYSNSLESITAMSVKTANIANAIDLEKYRGSELLPQLSQR